MTIVIGALVAVLVVVAIALGGFLLWYQRLRVAGARPTYDDYLRTLGRPVDPVSGRPRRAVGD